MRFILSAILILTFANIAIAQETSTKALNFIQQDQLDSETELEQCRAMYNAYRELILLIDPDCDLSVKDLV